MVGERSSSFIIHPSSSQADSLLLVEYLIDESPIEIWKLRLGVRSTEEEGFLIVARGADGLGYATLATLA